MIPNELRLYLETKLKTSVRGIRQLSGGGAAQTVRLDTPERFYLLKRVNPASSDVLDIEADGLQRLARAARNVVIPRVILRHSGSFGDVMVLAWLETVPPEHAHYSAFGRGLAHIHRTTAEQYGYGTHGYIGATRQFNTWASSWPTFYREQRLAPQVAMAQAAGLWQSSWSPLLEACYTAVPDVLPDQPPASLLHGDCWQGNMLFLSEGQCALIDPAVYYGDRETDLAMTQLFGGCSPVFYAAYNEAWPLEAGYAERKPLYDLYHMLNHLNLFGLAYAPAVQRILHMFA